MKKKLAAALAGVMVLTMGMATVFAATSPTVNDEGQAAVEDMVSETDTVTGLGSTDASVTVNDDGTYTITVDAADAEERGLVDGDTYYIYVNGVAVEATYEDGAFVISSDDVDLEDGEVLTVDVYTVEYEDESEEPSEDESEEPSEDESEEPSEEGSENTTGTTTGSDTTGTTTGSDTTGTTTGSDTTGTSSTGSGTSSPKTGAAAALPVLAVAALAGVVVCGKKVKFYE